ncbi:MAG TPA: family 78 glycoside hydrolase catalytic domain [Chryseolinea sp.]
MKTLISFLLALLVVPASFAQRVSFLQPAHLTCEYQNNPLGIDTSAPRLGWSFETAARDQYQLAYEIVVRQEAGQGSVWETGKVISSKNTLLDYKGEALRPFTRYYWKVRTYDAHDQPSGWSGEAWFETAMLSASDWQAKWIDNGSTLPARDEDFYKDDPMPLFRKTLNVQKKLASARLYISGLGYYEAYLNEKKVGDHVLDPGWTTYKKEALYVVHDITSTLKTGQNAIGIMLGNGWWDPLPLQLFGRFNLRTVQQTGRPCVKAEIHLNYADGTREVIGTDASWQTANGPIVRNNVYLGEHYDARLEMKGWNGLKSSGNAWKNASLAEGPAGTLHAQVQPPIRITRTLKPTRILEIKPGVYIADMGQNFAGVARITVKGKKGTKISLRYGEALLPDGTLNYLTTVAGQLKALWNINGGPGAPATAWQEDSFTLNGEGTETWSPRFTFHGFRYVEITGWPGKPSPDNIQGLRMNADLTHSGEFACSNDMFNKIHEAIQWTFLSNVFSVQSDCPGREKMGYGADMVVTANAFMYNFDMSNFYTKAVRDFANEQRPGGGITETAPYTGIADKGLGDESGPLGWQLGFPYLQEQLYEFYGDERIIATQYDNVVRQLAFLQSKAIDGLFHWDISDHVAIDPKPEALSASAFYYHHALLAAKFAGILKKPDDSVKYAKLAGQTKQRIVEKYLVPHTGRFDNGTQSAQLFALWYDLSPEKEKTWEVLMSEFARHKDHVASGIFGVKMMFDVLRQSGQNEEAYRIANQKDYPGWGFMLNEGATTLWESWEYPDNAPSQNHPMFGSIDEWFYRSLLGINPLAPGFRKIQIKPQPAGDLTWAKGSYASIQGKIVSEWKKEENRFQLTVSIPANTHGEVWIPLAPGADLKENGTIIGKEGMSKQVRYVEGYGVVEITSGDYTFEVTTHN